MKLRTNIFIQLLASAIQILNLILPVVPENKKIYVLIGLSVAQTVTGVIAHSSNYDGQSQTVAYKVELPSKLNLDK